MFFVSIDAVRPGDRVARAIYGDNAASPLIAAGAKLSEYELERLKQLGFQGIYITGQAGADHAPRALLSDATRDLAVESVSNVFSTLEQGGMLETEPLLHSVDEMMQNILGAGVVISTLTGLRTHDNYTFEHSVNVAAIALMIGEELQLHAEQLRLLGLGALLHDVGKTSLSPTILQKADRLTDVEYRNVQQHSELGYEILRAYEELDPVIAKIAYEHHERLDGRGYPRGLRGDEIDPLSKIVTVADVFDAMTADRVYRKGIPTARVLATLRDDIGAGYDEEAVNCLLRRVAPYPVGTKVRLNTGHVGTVVIVPEDVPELPTVRVKAEDNDAGDVLHLIYHLRHEPSLTISEIIE